MILRSLETGMLSSNCYIIGDNGEGAIIDAGVRHKEVLDTVEKENLKIRYIILTHGHIDHIISADELRRMLGAKVLIHEDDAKALPDPYLNGSALFGLKKAFMEADATVKDGDVIEVGGLKLEIIHTPGHTSGSISIKVDNCVFTGDTLFRMSIGRTDLGDGSDEELSDSLNNKLMRLADDVVVYPGHGPSSTIGYERENNPYI